MAASVSVVIPTYNRPRWLREAVESCLQQTHRPTEVIVVDDGSSTDAAGVIARPYPEVKYFFQENHGLGHARNAGLMQSSGDYVAFLDDDDWLTPDSLAVRLKILEAHPETGIVYSDLYLANTDAGPIGRYYGNWRRPLPTGDIYRSLLRRNFIPIHAILWRRAILDAVGGFPVSRLGAEDWYALIRVAERSHAQYVDQALGYYRLHNQNMTLNYSGQIMGSALAQQYVASSQRFAQLPGTYRAQILAAYAREQWLDGDAALGRAFLQLAHEADPASLLLLTLRSTMFLGRPFWRWLMRRYWQARAVLRQQPTASDYFLARA